MCNDMMTACIESFKKKLLKTLKKILGNQLYKELRIHLKSSGCSHNSLAYCQ